MRPFFVSASGGSTNTGSVDPLPEIAEICRSVGAWLHVDAAYGGFAALTDRGRQALVGIELADSVTLDPHKWLYQSYECGCVLIRDGAMLRRAFEIAPDYLLDAVPGEAEVNFSDLGLQLSRTSHALKVWTSVHTFGVAAFRAAIDRSIDQALLAQRLIEESETLEIVSPARLGVVCFRRNFPEARDEHESDMMHGALIAALERSGIAFVSSTRLRGRFSIRMCVMNFTTRDEDIEATISYLATEPVVRPQAPPPPMFEPHMALERGWLGRPGMTTGMLAAVPLFADLDAGQAERVLARASERTYVEGEQVIQQWEGSRELYVVLEGEAEIDRDGVTLATVGAGETIGEIAALEWGAGFGYARTATVRAKTPLRALVFAAGDVGELIQAVPVIGERLRAVARSRLHA